MAIKPKDVLGKRSAEVSKEADLIEQIIDQKLLTAYEYPGREFHINVGRNITLEVEKVVCGRYLEVGWSYFKVSRERHPNDSDDKIDDFVILKYPKE